MVWSKVQLDQHLLASDILMRVKSEAFDLIRSQENISEMEVQRFIIQRFKRLGVVTTKNTDLIVAFDEHAAMPHYRPTSATNKLLGSSGIVLIDIWGRLKVSRAPYADITWMGSRGSVPKETQAAFEAVLASRDAALRYLRKQLKDKLFPTGIQLHSICDNVIIRRGFAHGLKHSTGHSLGTTSPHGTYGSISKKNKNLLKPILGYTIEPGIYIDNHFGIRSEIDFFIDKKRKVIVTGPIQHDWVRV